MEDKVYADRIAKITEFRFSPSVARSFDDMALRSIPFYAEVQRMCAELAHNFYQKGSFIYDLGCSTGTTALYLSQIFGEEGFHYLGLDNAEAMVGTARENCQALPRQHNVSFAVEDILEIPFDKASVIIANYTLQFIRPLQRTQLIRRIFDSLQPGGAFLFSEKILESDSDTSRLFNRFYFELKKRNGYSKLEIAQKREALENVLIPYRVDENMAMLHDVGFENFNIFFKWYNFASFLACKKA